MSAFTLALTQFFRFFSTLFSAAEKLAKSADNLATVAEESSGQYMDSARMDRAVNRRRMELEHKLKVTELEVLEAEPVKATKTKPALAA